MGFVTGFMMITGWLVLLGCAVAYFGKWLSTRKMK